MHYKKQAYAVPIKDWKEVEKWTFLIYLYLILVYSGADKSLARPTSRCILFDGENISFDASLVLYTCIHK